MSSFQDTFTRNNQERELQYDDAAAYFFFASILALIFIPLVFHIFKAWFKKPKFDPKRIKCNWRQEINVAEFNKQKFSGFLYLKIFIAAVLFYLLVVCIWKGSEIKSFKSFDPYEILEIDPSATEQEIKKAYKTLAKKYHPDFNPGDPDAQNKFIILNQAYRCLTDDEVKEKCKAFGNPDGANNYQVGIALPSALLNKKNRSIILALFFLVLLVFLPITIWMWYSEKEKYDGFGVNKQSIFQTLHFMRNENITVQNVMEMMASSLEMGPIQPVKKGQGQGLKDIHDESLRTQMPRDRCPYLKPLSLLNGYMSRAKIQPALKEDLNYMHRKIPFLLSSLSDFSLELTMKQIQLYQDMKPMNYNSFMNVLYFSQLYYQGMKMGQSPLYQLPGMDESIISRINKKIKKMPSFGEVLNSEENLDKVLSCYEDAREQQRAKNYASLLPKIDFNIDIYVDEEGVKNPKVHVGDLMAIEISITDNSVEQGQDAHYMQSLTFPYLKFVNWHIFVLGKNKNNLTVIADFRMVKGDKKTVTEKIVTRMTQPGRAEIRLLLKPDCYVDIEQEKTVTFEIFPEEENKEAFVHPDDEEALKRPTLFDQVASQLKNQADSDEEEEEDDKTKGRNKKREGKAEKKADKPSGKESDEEEEEEVEEEEALTHPDGKKGK